MLLLCNAFCLRFILSDNKKAVPESFFVFYMVYLFPSFVSLFGLGKTYNWILFILKFNLRASLVAQWLRIRLPMRGTRVRALVWEDPTCRGATKPMCHDC